MRNRMLVLAGILFFSISFFISSAAAQQNPPPEPPRWRAQRPGTPFMMQRQLHRSPGRFIRSRRAGNRLGLVLRLKDELNLTDEQVENLQTIQTKARKNSIKIRADLDLARVEMQELLRADEIDAGAVDAKIEKMGKLRTQLQKERMHAKLAARSVLTAEQRQKLQEKKSQRRRKPQRRGGF